MTAPRTLKIRAVGSQFKRISFAKEFVPEIITLSPYESFQIP
jgi:hypothetical protein